MNGAHVEEGLGVQQRLWLRCGDPCVKGVCPLRNGHAPVGVHGHHVAWAENLTCGVEAGAHIVGEVFKVVTVEVGVVGIVQDEGVVLVRCESHAAPPLGAQHHKCVWDGRWAELFFSEGDEVPGKGVGGHSEQAGDFLCGGTAFDESHGDVGCGFVDLAHVLRGGSPGQVGGEVDGVVTEESHNVGGGDDAGDSALVNHGQVVDAHVRHDEHRFKGEGIGGDGAGVGSHDLCDRQGHVHVVGYHAPAHVAVGDNPFQSPVS